MVCTWSNQIFWTWWSKGVFRKPAILSRFPKTFICILVWKTGGISVNESIHSTIIYWAPIMHQVQTKPKGHMGEQNQRGSPSAWSQVKWYIRKEVAQPCPILCEPMEHTVHGILQARILEWVTFPFSRGSSQPADWTQVQSSTFRVDSLPAEPQGKSKNTGVGTYPFSRGSSWPRNRTGVSRIAGRFFTNGAMSEA